MLKQTLEVIVAKDSIPRLRTVGVIADDLSEPIHRVDYAIRAFEIKPAATAGRLRLFDLAAVEQIWQALNPAGSDPLESSSNQGDSLSPQDRRRLLVELGSDREAELPAEVRDVWRSYLRSRLLKTGQWVRLKTEERISSAIEKTLDEFRAIMELDPSSLHETEGGGS